MRPRPAASPALAELLGRDGTLDRILSGGGLLFERPVEVGPPPTPPPPIVIPPADWEAEARERAEREAEEQRQEHERQRAELLAELEPAESPPRPTAPAGRKRGWRKARAA
jgi:hypothetical protein